MTFPHSPQPGPRPGPMPGGFRPGPQVNTQQINTQQPNPQPYAESAPRIVEETGHPAVDAVLRSLANAAQLAPGEQIAAYEAAHQVLQETLSSIEG
ncbi:NADPH-dependent curcumin reductase CurA [Actinoplanes tereljensis]|uniref:Uncharacterized protein n=1 Tax=Paractinoplanes tereljensis TaxID=571912 RepID=A0A919NZN3_9ACTN|nr:hypothetical protein [Actinoplanes tereljensis]GIF26876.1 hypothetical protein Ate02nite_96060 [Actinoplanes tereljensis]